MFSLARVILRKIAFHIKSITPERINSFCIYKYYFETEYDKIAKVQAEFYVYIDLNAVAG